MRIFVVGSIIAGIATPTESAALGAVASLITALAYGLLRLSNFMVSVAPLIAMAMQVIAILIVFPGLTLILANLITR